MENNPVVDHLPTEHCDFHWFSIAMAMAMLIYYPLKLVGVLKLGLKASKKYHFYEWQQWFWGAPISGNNQSVADFWCLMDIQCWWKFGYNYRFDNKFDGCPIAIYCLPAGFFERDLKLAHINPGAFRVIFQGRLKQQVFGWWFMLKKC